MEELLFRKLHLWGAQQASVRLHRRETESQTAQLSGHCARLTDGGTLFRQLATEPAGVCREVSA